MTKAEQRKVIKKRLKELSLEKKEQASKSIVLKLEQMPQFQQAKKVLLYDPLASEPDISSLCGDETANLKSFALPRICEDGITMEARQITPESRLRLHTFGMHEPDIETTSLMDIRSIDFVLVPGLGFDRQGTRLGRGKGFYDRFLSQFNSTTCLVGCFFSCQQLDLIQREVHDVSLSFIVTESEILKISN